MKRLALMLLLGATPAVAHDIYNGVKDFSGRACCGGDPVTGDCEKLEAEQIRFNRGGTVSMFSKRYNAWITVSRDIVIPAAIPGDDGAAGHYCGVPRGKIGQAATAPTEDQPDRVYITYCAFVRPGGA